MTTPRCLSKTFILWPLNLFLMLTSSLLWMGFCSCLRGWCCWAENRVIITARTHQILWGNKCGHVCICWNLQQIVCQAFIPTFVNAGDTNTSSLILADECMNVMLVKLSQGLNRAAVLYAITWLVFPCWGALFLLFRFLTSCFLTSLLLTTMCKPTFTSKCF